jgi:hypothetical protein
MSDVQIADPFVGAWTLNLERSRFDANHNPRGGTMVFEHDSAGGYVMKAEGVGEDGRKVAERPQHFILDDAPHPLTDFPQLVAVSTRPTPNALHGEVRRQDGSIVGEGDYVVSADGRSMTATATGFDAQLRRFQVTTVWDRA